MLLEETLKKIRPLDRAVEIEAQRRLDSLTKPQGSLGKLEELARHVAVIQGKVPPRLGRKLLFVFAADHGITQEGVSAYPEEVTAQMTYNFLRGGAAINVLARHYGVDVEVIDAGVDYEFPAVPGLRNCKVRRGSHNFSRGPAMTRLEAVQSIETGIGLVEEVALENPFLLGAGEMGIGNT
ncbi:MAG TPA: nicotinate-nucleotide--dimethylbenzimidazole phosphoribosyltransferase, partial [Candidatus Binatia bacterium]|nr:nicotinate-nucleotide--dimethylbenzimidazole phosphoribosyltransferase [Candidatus Binatia bacterium]